jgi:hypothetical protein
MSNGAIPIHPVYLPFTREQLAPHFGNDKHLDYFVTSAIRYSEFVGRFGTKFDGMPITEEVRRNRQIEKDERFWTVCTLKVVFDAGRFADILRLAFGSTPPLTGFATWEQCVGGTEDQELRFEVSVSSPQGYRDALRSRYLTQGASAHLVPYVVHAAKGRTAYEGATKVDAAFLNRRTGFCVMFEAKVLSDISCEVTFDPFRNQLARNIDVMLDRRTSFLPPDPAKRLLALLTPQVFKDKHSTRYYGLLFHEYKRNPSLLNEHIEHRDATSLAQVPDRLGWLTFEGCLGVCPTCCPWLQPREANA